MKTYKLYTPKPYEVVDKINCDLCGKEISKRRVGFKIEEVQIGHKFGEVYPDTESGSGEEIEIDMCPNCFKNILLPWVKKISIVKDLKLEYKKWDY